MDSAWLMTVLPHPNAPGIAHVPARKRVSDLCFSITWFCWNADYFEQLLCTAPTVRLHAVRCPPPCTAKRQAHIKTLRNGFAMKTAHLQAANLQASRRYTALHGGERRCRARTGRSAAPDVQRKTQPTADWQARLQAMRCRTAKHGGEEGIQHALPGQQRRVGQQLLRDRPRRPHRPHLQHSVLLRAQAGRHGSRLAGMAQTPVESQLVASVECMIVVCEGGPV